MGEKNTCRKKLRENVFLKDNVTILNHILASSPTVHLTTINSTAHCKGQNGKRKLMMQKLCLLHLQSGREKISSSEVLTLKEVALGKLFFDELLYPP